MFLPLRKGVCHLSNPPVARRLQQPTPRHGRAAHWNQRGSVPVYLALQHAGCAATYVAICSGGLLPRLFTLADICEQLPAVVFCHIDPRRRHRLSVRKCVALCCPDFPLYVSWRPVIHNEMRLQSTYSDRPLFYLSAKLSIKCEKNVSLLKFFVSEAVRLYHQQ